MSNDWSEPPTNDFEGDPMGIVGPDGELSGAIEDIIARLGGGVPAPRITKLNGIHPVTDMFLDFFNAAPPWVPNNVTGITGFEFGVRLALLRPDLAELWVEKADAAGPGENPAGAHVADLIERGEANSGPPLDDMPNVDWKD